MSRLQKILLGMFFLAGLGLACFSSGVLRDWGIAAVLSGMVILAAYGIRAIVRRLSRD